MRKEKSLVSVLLFLLNERMSYNVRWFFSGIDYGGFIYKGGLCLGFNINFKLNEIILMYEFY